jgi:predicted transcriptional regulator
MGLSQGEFAKIIERSQGIVSKYESGKVKPPADVIMHCMHNLESSRTARSENVQSSDPRWQAVSSALHQLNRALEALVPR